MNDIESIVLYIKRYITSRLDTYLEDTRHYGNTRYSQYDEEADVVQAFRDISYTLQEKMNPSIPEGFPSPKALLEWVRLFHAYATERELLAIRISEKIYTEKKWIPQGVERLQEIAKDCREFAEYILSQEYSKKVLNAGFSISAPNPLEKGSNVTRVRAEPLINLHRIFLSFPRLAHCLESPNRNKKSYLIEDEYDLQQIFEGALRLYFNNVQREETTPTRAGSSSDVDFYISEFGILIENKFIHDSYTNKKIKIEFDNDLNDYRNHRNADTLIYFVYDPKGILKNPEGMVKDFNSSSDDKFKIVTYIIHRGQVMYSESQVDGL